MCVRLLVFTLSVNDRACYSESYKNFKDSSALIAVLFWLLYWVSVMAQMPLIVFLGHSDICSLGDYVQQTSLHWNLQDFGVSRLGGSCLYFPSAQDLHGGQHRQMWSAIPLLYRLDGVHLNAEGNCCLARVSEGLS